MNAPAGAAAVSADQPSEEYRSDFFFEVDTQGHVRGTSRTSAAAVVPCCASTGSREITPSSERVHGLRSALFDLFFYFSLMIIFPSDDKRGNKKILSS